MEVKKNAAILALAFFKLFGDCAPSPADAEALIDNATGYADGYAVWVGSPVPPLCIPRWSTQRAGGLVCS